MVGKKRQPKPDLPEGGTDGQLGQNGCKVDNGFWSVGQIDKVGQ